MRPKAADRRLAERRLTGLRREIRNLSPAEDAEVSLPALAGLALGLPGCGSVPHYEGSAG